MAESIECPDGIAKSCSPALEPGMKSVFSDPLYLRTYIRGFREVGNECLRGTTSGALCELFPICKMIPHLNLLHGRYSAGCDDTELEY